MKIIITGATGHFGRQVTDELLKSRAPEDLILITRKPERLADLAARLAAGSGLSVFTGRMVVWPVNGPITSPFGMRWGRLHAGIDIGVPTGTPIHAAAEGIVIFSGWQGGYGNLVLIAHGNGIVTGYGHQSSIAVGDGAHVSQGEVIGYTGCTGHCTGPHLHFEVRVNGTPVNPLGYL